MAFICTQGFETMPAGVQAGTNNGSASDGQALSILSSQGFICPASVSAPTTVLINGGARYTGGQYLNPYAVSASQVTAAPFMYGYSTGKTVIDAITNGLACGMALRLGTSGTTYTTNGIQGTNAGFGSLVSNSNTYFMGIYRSSASQLTAYVGANIAGTANATPFNFAEDNNWHYYEFVIMPVTAGSTFQFYVLIDGQILYQSAVLTVTSNTTMRNYILGAGCEGNGTASYKHYDGMDDFYISDRTGTTNNDPYLGEIQIRRRSPTADVQAQWTPVGGAASNAASVSSLDYRNPTKYVTTGTADATDIYSSTDTIPAGAPVIRAVNIEVYSNRSTIIAAQNAAVITNGSTTIAGPSWTPTYYTGFNKTTWERNPITDQPFTASEVNSYNFGIKKTG